MDEREQAGDAATPAKAAEVIRELRACARAGMPPSAMLREVAGRYDLSLRGIQRVLGDAFGLPLQAQLRVALWPPVGAGRVTDLELDAELGEAIAATRGVWDAGGWPFADPEWTVAASTERVRAGAAPIRSVERDAALALWFFHDAPPCGLGEVWAAPLWEVYRLDPTVGGVADLPPGWVAERDAPGQPWRRRPATRA